MVFLFKMGASFCGQFIDKPAATIFLTNWNYNKNYITELARFLLLILRYPYFMLRSPSGNNYE